MGCWSSKRMFKTFAALVFTEIVLLPTFEESRRCLFDNCVPVHAWWRRIQREVSIAVSHGWHDNCTIGIFQLYSSTTNLNIAAVDIIGIFKHLFTDLMQRLITNEISNHLVLTATMLDVYFAIKNVTPE